jgi:3-deoxy-D-manno-octulosonic acid kinase
MSEGQVLHAGRHAMLAETTLGEVPTPAWFDPAEWQRQGAAPLETPGRGAVLIVERGAGQWVLRHYRRGGLVSRFVEDHYVWLGLERTRPFREWRMLRRLHDAGLPVPNPIAAHVYRTGAIYTGDIVTAYLPNTRPLSWFIAQAQVPPQCWQRIGQMVRIVHEHGVDHPDLTAHNILLDERNEPFLVDFDNARSKPPGAWRRRGVERLQRSLRKVALETGTQFDAAAWLELEQGYQQAAR